MRNTHFKISAFTILLSSAIHVVAKNSVERLVRKRLDSSEPSLILPKDNDIFLETYFGRSIEAEFSYSFSYMSFSFSYEYELPWESEESEAPSFAPSIRTDDVHNNTSPPEADTLFPSRSPSFDLAKEMKDIAPTLVPTPFIDGSNDDTAPPTIQASNAPSLLPTTGISGVPTISISEDVTGANLQITDSTVDTSIISDEVNSSSASMTGAVTFLIPAFGVVAGALLVSGIIKKMKSRNAMEYSNLDCDSMSSFSLPV